MATTDADARLTDRVTFFKRKVSALFQRAKGFENELSTSKLNDLDPVELEVHLLRIEQTKSTFNGAHNSLEELDFDEIGSKVRDDFDDLMAKLEARVSVIIQKHQSNAPPHSTFGRYDDTLNQTVIVANKTRLPELKLPTFSDGYTEYANFYAMFESVVDKDPELTNIEKLQHLGSCLSGPALDAAHVKEILGLKRVDNESASQLRQFSDKVNSHMRALKTLGNLEQISGCFIVQTLLQKLDVKTQKKWDVACSSDKVPTAEEFFEFLERRCQKLDSVQYSTSANSHALGPASTSSAANSPSSTTARSATSLAAQGLQSGVGHALTADICKMYRCVRVAMPDSLYQCILWRDSPEEDIKVFKLDTVTYGTKSASFQSVRAMHQLAIDERDAYPIGSRALQQEFYVDDFISGANSMEEARQKMDQTCAILARGQFKLRKWCWSHEKVLDGVAAENREQFLKFDHGSDVTKALGLQLCKDQLTWDESLPLARDTAWKELCSSFQNIPHVSFPRVVLIADAEVEIHGFCDASLEAYGACVYVVTRGQTVTSRLLCSKSRVAPLKTLSVPKLELCGAKLLASLIFEIKRTGIFFSQFYCWCDSVSAIQELTLGMQWHHVPTDRNPADILSKGAFPEVLAQDDLWFHGPSYLVDGRPSWPASCIPEKPTIELRKSALIVKSPHADLTLGYIHHGTRILLRLVQMTNHWDDMKEIRSHGNVRKSSSIAALAPFLDECGLLRVGGRLCNSSLDYDGQHPIILPQRHAITQALIVQFPTESSHRAPCTSGQDSASVLANWRIKNCNCSSMNIRQPKACVPKSQIKRRDTKNLPNASTC
ncbi:hypothetical protein ACLKA6_012210 [Drosophila palustris]